MQFLGLLLIIFGALAIVNQFVPIMFWDKLYIGWPIIIILYGIYRLFNKRKSKSSSLIIISIGVILQISKMPWFYGSARQLIIGFGVLLIGLFLIMPENRRNRTINKDYEKYEQAKYKAKENFRNFTDEDVKDGGSYGYNPETGKYEKNKSSYEDFHREDNRQQYERYNRNHNNRNRKTHEEHTKSGDFTILNIDMFHHNYLFENDIIVLNSSSFSGGLLDVKFSTITLDLRNIQALEYEINIDCNILFSTLKVMVPENWEIIIKEKNQPYKNIIPKNIDNVLVFNKTGVAGDIIII